jgi:hypothetical protein
MEKINYYLIKADDILNDYSFNNGESFLEEYKNGGRQDVFENPIIFAENVTSILKKNKNFSYFNKVNEIEKRTIVIIGLYLEILEYLGESNKLIKIIEDTCEKYPNNLIIGYWNHDNDFSKYNSTINKFENLMILNHGYISMVSKNNLLLPFWNIDESDHDEIKTQFSSFVGKSNNGLRLQLIKNIISYNSPEITYSETYGDEYYKNLSSTIFSLCPLGGGGGGGFSYRVFEAIQNNSIPVIIVDNLNYPMADVLDWGKICVRIPQNMINNVDAIIDILKGINYHEMIEYIKNNKRQLTLLGVQEYLYKKILLKINELI